MYTTYFGLREMPFSITPDPAYLYMSPRHQEALGHLLYGTGQYGGFVQLTGEVGTGKTTIVRTLLAQKLEHVDVAVILNPRQSEIEFVASICDELHVKYPKRGTLKTRVDALNEHLLKSHTEGRRTVVIIDEAQNLQPEVLEQVRLLTNLETHKEKLLRIMLVGQPELAVLLARPDLRQLAQRITARYHLMPLSANETSEYIAHRLGVAGGGRELFSARAVAAVHRHARGVPRLINILCDRALLGAYATGHKQVTPEIVERAAREVGGETAAPPGRRVTLLDAVLVAAILAGGAWWFLHDEIQQAIEQVPAQAGRAAYAAPVAAEMSSASTSPAQGTPPAPQAVPQVDALLRAAQPLPLVLARLIQVWNVSPRVSSTETVCQALAREKLACYKGSGDWNDLRRYDRPAILTLSSGRGGVQHVLLRQLGAGDAVIETASATMRLPLEQVDLLWTGEFLVLWHRDVDEMAVGPDSKPASLAWLRTALGRAQGRALPVGSKYDDDLKQALMHYQSAQGLTPDGIAGARTLIALSTLTPPAAGTPTLKTLDVAHP